MVMPWVAARVPDTRSREGCQCVEVTTNLDNADNLVLVERRATRKDCETTWAGDSSAVTSTRWLRCWPNRRSIRYFKLTTA